jgi:serine protease Do
MPADLDVAAANPSPTETPAPANLASLGLTLEPSANGDGLTITAIEPGSSAEERGLRVGDTILQLNGTDVASLQDIKKELETAGTQGQKKVLMLVRSGERQRFVAMPVEKPKT